MSRIWCGVAALVTATTLQVTAQQSSTSGPRGATPRSTVARTAPARLDAPRILPGTPSNVFSTIQGNALTPNDAALPNAFVRLRNARIGQIIDSQTTDQAGLFAFRSVDPGTYIVEIVDARQTAVLAASQILNAGPGEAISAIVKLPFYVGPYTAVFGANPASISVVTAQAASAGVLASQVSGTATCEQVR
jgi:hypothetical protein